MNSKKPKLSPTHKPKSDKFWSRAINGDFTTVLKFAKFGEKLERPNTLPLYTCGQMLTASQSHWEEQEIHAFIAWLEDEQGISVKDGIVYEFNIYPIWR